MVSVLSAHRGGITALQKGVESNWPDALGQMAGNLEEGRNPYPHDSAKAREYALRAGYACSWKGSQTLTDFYREGLAGFPRDEFLANVWGYILRLIDIEENGKELANFPIAQPEQFFPPDQARILRTNAKLVMDQCARAREEVLVKERPRWAEVTKELRQELAPLVKMVEEERRAKERARMPWWKRIFN